VRSFLVSFAVWMALTVMGGLAFIYSGLFDVAASEPHWRITHWILETARTRSIKVHAADIRVPRGLDDPALVLIGTEHFAAHCAVCHGAPGVPKGEISDGLNPQPPDLAHSSQHYSSSELFWIVKHGIKMTGMPAWGDHSDDELWATVAFIEKLPGMNDQDYAKLVAASRAQGGHHHETHEAQPQTGTAQPGGRPDHDHPADHRH
jgi:mono/diheme cytochrome c family protein